jgi:glycosyltransferase involved in cell wall biosynthesis
MLYDFILFENWYQATNHHKDVGLIASMLKDCGYTAAVADVYQNIDRNYIEGVPCISIQHKASFLDYPKSGLMSKWPFVKIVGIINRHREAQHLKSVMKELEGQFKRLYCGSYYVKMPIGWLRKIPDNSCAFFWGLRSVRLIQYKNNAFDFAGISSYFLRRYFDRHPNLKFFVSDQLIREEFLNLGISPDRLVIRPERFIEDYSSVKNGSDGMFTLLSIGSLRPQKRIELILESLAKLDENDIQYVIAGASTPSYESIIDEGIRKTRDGMVIRINRRLTENEFNNHINKADFLVLCDCPQASNVTNGTMNEALLVGVPIIAPNYDPYKYFIEHYHVGVMFNPDEVGSLESAIRKAKQLGRDTFARSIHHYQSLYLKKNVVKAFAESLKQVI